MEREQLRERRTYLALDAKAHPWPLVRVTQIWDADDHEGVAFDILDDDGDRLMRNPGVPVHDFLESYRPAFEALDDPDALALTQVQFLDAVQEIRQLAQDDDDDDAAANLEEKVHRAALHACALGHRDARALAARALATDEISFQRHTW